MLLKICLYTVCAAFTRKMSRCVKYKVKKNQCCNEKENYYNVFTHLTWKKLFWVKKIEKN